MTGWLSVIQSPPIWQCHAFITAYSHHVDCSIQAARL